MFRIATICFASGLWIATQVQANDRVMVGWDMMPDPAAQTYVDPYRDMQPKHLWTLQSLVRQRAQLEGSSLSEDVYARTKAAAAEKEAELTAAGIDIDWVLAQRWEVAERRKKAATRGNPTLDGASVSVGGFLIPAPPAEDGRLVAYLVPERGMCSHVPPPPPNQLIRIEADEMPDNLWIYSPVTVKGTLSLSETQYRITVVDGPVLMQSSWRLRADRIETLQR